jgi:hypothetical protein
MAVAVELAEHVADAHLLELLAAVEGILRACRSRRARSTTRSFASAAFVSFSFDVKL